MTIKEINRSIAIDPVEYVNTDKGIEDCPVGHILTQMGKTAPKHYLICDGAIYNITEYSHLSQYIKDQFGIFNFFGGDGITTFAVPDLRDDFLRGYHGDKTEKLSGEIGVRQEGTQHINFLVDSGSHIYLNGEYGTSGVLPAATDKLIPSTNSRGWTNVASLTNWVAGGGYTKYTSRPTNKAVLYCIKYEPTYFMSIHGLTETTTLWEGNVGTSGTTQVSRSISLASSILEYDEIGFYYQAAISTAIRLDYNSFPSDRFKTLIESPLSDIHLSLNWGQSPHISFADIEKTSNYSNLNILMYQSYITKITGVKYKTFQN